MVKRILLLSRSYSPLLTPRAFRTRELVNELLRRGYYISAVLPSYADIDMKRVDVRFIKSLTISLQKGENTVFSIKQCLLDSIRTTSKFFFGDTPGDIIYSFRMIFDVICLLKKCDYDVILSIGCPFYIHVAAVLGRFLAGERVKIIAECSDPFYEDKCFIKAFYLKYVEGIILQDCDYITIPMEAARKSYADYGIDDKIRIVPQGFAITQIDDDVYRHNAVPMFCFAGVLYEKIRNPRYFLDYLLQVKQDFIFVVYALPDAFTMSLLEEYKAKLGDRLEIREPLAREELIRVMAGMEFVVNFDNENSNQKPSKLIDYAMSKRPILSFNSRTFRAEVFEAFLRGDYTQRERIDLSKYDIRNVVDKFEALFALGK